MKKIGLLSVYNHNFGSILQAFAMQSALRESGFNTEIILYKKTDILKQAKRLLYLPLLKATVKMKWKSVYCRVFHKGMYKQVLASREQAFSEFIKKNMFFSKQFVGREALIAGTNEYDFFVLGSDQVWNPMNLGGDFYTMTFIPDNKTKITYAPSFGVSSIPKKQKGKTAEYLKRINNISVRENDGVRIVRELTGREVQQVVDPTLLVDTSVWDSIKGTVRVVKERYILCYFISSNSEYRSFAKRLAQKTGLILVSIPHVDEFVKSDVNFGDIQPQGVGPSEFVNLIANAEFVCTDSFHGSVFSTIYQVPFFTFSRYISDGAESTNSRIYSFLQMINMQDRLFNSRESIDDSDLNVDFMEANSLIEHLRFESWNYLNDALEKAGNDA